MERIYTIPVNEAFDASASDPACGCPICALYRKLEEDELELILGGSMMEPDVRIRTNELGFCGTHFDRLFTRKNRLGLALILESHLAEIKGKLAGGGLSVGGRGRPCPMGACTDGRALHPPGSGRNAVTYVRIALFQGRFLLFYRLVIAVSEKMRYT